MIVKDEAPVIRRCLASVRPLVDHWLIVDTGSSDGTQNIVREAMAGLPGELVERPWVDFAHNRSEALELARPHAAYSLIIDADDELVLPPDFTRPALTADSYVVDIEDASTTYQRTQLVANKLAWRYRGVLHEFLESPGAEQAGHFPVVMRRNHDGRRRRDPTTYSNDAAILTRALETETTHSSSRAILSISPKAIAIAANASGRSAPIYAGPDKASGSRRSMSACSTPAA
jgi:glycosyltransferase involved in cell wall biosynthesis